MPTPSQLAHRNVTSTALPYKSNVSPSDTTPLFVSGSTDILTSVAGYAERRPGFATNVETSPTVFNNLQRLFTWNRFDGTFVEMACDINASSLAVVYKRIIGQDASFISIFTDTTNTPFDFVVSNNTVYFSNGNVAKKWNPNDGVSNWGIAAGSNSANTTGPNIAGAGADNNNNANIWTNPNNVTSLLNYATNTIFNTDSDGLNASTFGFGITSTTTIKGFQIAFDVFTTNHDTVGGTATIGVALTQNGVYYGTRKTVDLTFSSSVTTIILGSSSDLWGGTWTPANINASTSGCNFIFTTKNCPVGGTGFTVNVRNVRITVFGIGGPSVSLSGTGLTATVGYQYVTCYGNSKSGHVSSPSSASSVVKPANQQVNVTIQASSDTQVNQIRVFRSTDSVTSGTNAGIYFELPNSPFSNTNQTIVDVAADTSLNIDSIAPIPGANDPPTPGQQPVYFSGRIWLFKDNQVFFSGLEETIIGVPEESFQSGIAGNFWNFDEPVKGLAVTGNGVNQGLMVFCGGRIYGISGNSLDTFRRFLVSDRRGCRNSSTITSLGGMVAWYDSSSTIWVTDGESMQEISTDIRPDLVGLSPNGASFTFHVSGKYHWLVCAFPTKIFVYDMDLQQWMPPWIVANNFVFSGETSAGSYNLLLSNGTKALQLSTTAFNDNGVLYTPVIITSNFSIVPDYGKRFSYGSLGVYDEPSRTGQGWYFQIDSNSTLTFNDIALLVDDDPLNSSSVYLTIAANKITPNVAWNRRQGTNLCQNIYSISTDTVAPVGRWYSIKLTLRNLDVADKIYDWFLAYSQKR